VFVFVKRRQNFFDEIIGKKEEEDKYIYHKRTLLGYFGVLGSHRL